MRLILEFIGWWLVIYYVLIIGEHLVTEFYVTIGWMSRREADQTGARARLDRLLRLGSNSSACLSKPDKRSEWPVA